jgi:bacterioferritin-associated ferredoxin
MYVCLCNGVTERAIRQAVSDGACTMRQLRLQLGVSTRCGKCAPTAQKILLNQLASMTREHVNAEEPARAVAHGRGPVL